MPTGTSHKSLPWDRFSESRTLSEQSSREHPVLVIGAGLAGCWTARHLAEIGMSVRVLEARSQPACAASGNPAGMVKPFVTRSPGFAMDFYVHAHAFLRQQLKKLSLEKACGYSACGVLQLVQKSYPASSHYQVLNQTGTCKHSGTTVDAQSIYFEKAGWLNPHSLCNALLQHPLISLETDISISSINALGKRPSGPRWQLVSNSRCLLSTHVVIASGICVDQTEQTAHLPVVPARGQISRFNYQDSVQKLERIVNGKHYAIPDGNSLLVGATFQRDCCDENVREDDHTSNRDGLKAMLPDIAVDAQPVKGYAGIRATTPDRLPLAGPLPDYIKCEQVYKDLHHGRSLSNYPCLPVHEGLYVLGGLGSRGITTAALAAALLVKLMSESATIDSDHGCWSHWAPLLNPVRFQIRALKRKIP